MSGELPARLAVLAEKGDDSKAASEALVGALSAAGSSEEAQASLFETLDRCLRDWGDGGTAKVLTSVVTRVQNGRELSPGDLESWLTAHKDAPALAADCIELEPPEQIRVLRRVSQVGSQKVVYEALWEASQRTVMLKRFLDKETEQRLVKRELQPHPLSMEHPNIIETHLFLNDSGRPFLVEKRLWQALSDDWTSRGVREAAALLHDISAALAFLRDEGLIHGDVKPDNIGYEEGRYVLLDFGISRPATEFGVETTATGSIRTRGPELLTGTATHSFASDVWSLAATVLNAAIGRFPLVVDTDEPLPRVSEPERRKEFEAELKRRAGKWSEWVEPALQQVTYRPLRDLLSEALAPDADARPEAVELARRCRVELEALISDEHGPGRDLPRREQVAQLSLYLPTGEAIELLPMRKKMELQARVAELRSAPTLDNSEREDLDLLSSRLEPILGPQGT